MKVLFVSGSLSNRLQRELYSKYGLGGGFAIQKYYKLMEEGFARNGVEIEALSIVPIPKADAPFVYQQFKNEKERNVNYRYVPYLRFPLFYFAFMFIYVFLRVFLWSLKNRKEGIVLCDILNPCLCLGVSRATSLVGIKRVAWVTDMPGMSGAQCIHYEEMNALGKMQMRSIHNYSAFIFMTEATNIALNPYHRPYMIMEGIVDPDIEPLENTKKDETRDILYAGGLNEAYGLGFLCEAFSKIDGSDLRLVIYGDGTYKKKIENYALLDKRIVYKGTAQNSVIVEAERKATVLVNPRFTGAEYTYYSFPSKNIEYMVSGTPIVTTRLAGIPAEYEPYIFTFDEETIDGYKNTLEKILHQSERELNDFGAKAQQFILERKNAVTQVERLLIMMYNL